MSYAAIEAQLKTLLETACEHVTRGDSSILDTGITSAIVLEPGSFVTEPHSRAVRGALPERVRSWDTLIHVIVMYHSDRVVSTDLADLRDDVVELIDKYPTLSTAGLKVTGLNAEGDPQDVYDNPDTGPSLRLPGPAANRPGTEQDGRRRICLS